MVKHRAVRNMFLAVACVLLVLGLYQCHPRAGDYGAGAGTVRIMRRSVPPENLMLRSMALNTVGAFDRAQPEIENATFYQRLITYRGNVHPRAGEFSYCGRISTVNLPGIHTRYRNFVAAVWLSFDGTPLPVSEQDVSFVLLDNSGDGQAHARFVSQSAVLCKNEILREASGTSARSGADNKK
jgi:hypothetical protein